MEIGSIVMRALAEARWWAALLAVAASCLTLQAAPAGPQVELTVRARPDSAFVYASSHDRPQPVLLGRVNRPLALAASRFQGGVLFTLGGGPPRPDGTIPELAGYQSASFPATNPIYAGARSPGAAGSYLYPAPGQDELQLAPEPGLAGWWHRHSGEVATGLVLLALAGLVRFRRSARPALAALRRRAPQRKVRPQRMNTEDDIYVGRTFGAWTTTARLGAGGMATVYRAVSKRSGGAELAAAIKVMNPVLLRDDEYRKRFSREIAIWSRLNHPHVVRMIDSGETDEVLYLVMELVEGKTLRALLPENGMPLPQALHYAIGICQGLAYAHGQGVVHRDLKPDNVMVNRSGQIKITDLGLAKQESSENLTLKGDTFGTPAYMAPEQITGGTLLPASDQYGLAVMLFEMLTGRRPFHVPDSVTLVMKHLQEAPPRVRTVKTQLPQELDALIDRMLEKDPARRMPDMESVSEQLRAIRRRYCPE